MKAYTIILSCIIAATALAGCADNDDATPPADSSPTPATTPTPLLPTPTPTPAPTDNGTAANFTLTAANVPTTVFAGEAFTFNLTIAGETEMETDHIGAHYNTTPNPEPAGAYGKACEHQPGTVPGEFVVRCTFAEEGEHFLRGHLRVNDSGTLRNFWTDEFEVVARGPVGNHTLATSGMPTLPVTAGSTFNFTLAITGDADVSDHIGGHFGANSSATPKVSDYPLACAHTAGSVPGEYAVSCEVPATAAPGTYHLRGHMRITVDSMKHDFWAPETSFVVV